MRRCLLLTPLLFLLSIAGTYAQKQEQALVDSLEHAVPVAKDTNRVAVFLSLSYAYTDINTDKSLKYAQEALKLATELHWKRGMAGALNDIGLFYLSKGNCQLAASYFEQNLKISEEIGDKKGQAHALGNLGYIYYDEKDYAKALEHYRHVAKIASDIGDKKGLALAWAAIGNVYDLQKNFDMAQDCFSKELNLYKDMNDSSAIATALGSLGSSYTDQRKYAEGWKYTREALEMAKKTGDIYLQSKTTDNLGITLYFMLIDTTRSAAYINQELKKMSLLTDRESLIDSALYYQDMALSLDKQLSDTALIMETYETLAETYRLKGDYKRSWDYLKSFIGLKDAIVNVENQIKIREIEAKHEMELKQKQIEIDKLEIAKKHSERWFFYCSNYLPDNHSAVVYWPAAA